MYDRPSRVLFVFKYANSVDISLDCQNNELKGAVGNYLLGPLLCHKLLFCKYVKRKYAHKIKR